MPLFVTIPWYVILENSMPLFEKYHDMWSWYCFNKGHGVL
jgi:hypothetical protein